MHQVWELTLQAHIQVFLNARVIRAPQLSCDEDILPLYVSIKGFLQPISDSSSLL